MKTKKTYWPKVTDELKSIPTIFSHNVLKLSVLHQFSIKLMGQRRYQLTNLTLMGKRKTAAATGPEKPLQILLLAGKLSPLLKRPRQLEYSLAGNTIFTRA
jgi:hypothetical protein